MHTYIALFRAINVAGKNVLPMKKLIAILEGTGARNVRTYLQSGNAVFGSADNNLPGLSTRLTEEVNRRLGFVPQILILSLDEIESGVAANPFMEAEADPTSLHLGFLAYIPKNPDLNKLEGLKNESERFQLSDRVFYLHAPEGVGRSRLAANAEKLLGVPMTDRNWRTVCAIREMAREQAVTK